MATPVMRILRRFVVDDDVDSDEDDNDNKEEVCGSGEARNISSLVTQGNKTPIHRITVIR